MRLFTSPSRYKIYPSKLRQYWFRSSDGRFTSMHVRMLLSYLAQGLYQGWGILLMTSKSNIDANLTTSCKMIRSVYLQYLSIAPIWPWACWRPLQQLSLSPLSDQILQDWCSTRLVRTLVAWCCTVQFYPFLGNGACKPDRSQLSYLWASLPSMAKWYPFPILYIGPSMLLSRLPQKSESKKSEPWAQQRWCSEAIVRCADWRRNPTARKIP